MTIEFAFEGFITLLLVFTRFAGMIAINPLFSRNNVPGMVRLGLSAFLTLLVAPTVSMAAMPAVQGFSFVFALIRELAVGFMYGYVFQIFYYFLFFAGDLIDTDIGLGMAKTMDPATQIQVSFAGSLITMIFSLYIFASGSHLALIRIFAESFEHIPPGAFTLTSNVASYAIQLFISVFLLVLRLAAPFMAAEFVLQAAMGILMRFIPQITVFVINFQLRIILGILMLFLFAPFIGQFIDQYISVLFDTLLDVTTVMSAAGAAG